MQLRKWIHVTWFTDYRAAAPDNHIQKGSREAWAGRGAQREGHRGGPPLVSFQSPAPKRPEKQFQNILSVLFSFLFPFLHFCVLFSPTGNPHVDTGEEARSSMWKVDMLSSKKMSQPLKPRGSSGSQPARRGRQRMTHWVIGGQDGETVGQREGSQGGWGSNPDSAPDWVLFTLPLSSQVEGQRWRLHFRGLMATLANIGMPNLCWAKAIKKILFDMLHFHFIQLMYLLFSIENSSLSRELYRSTNSASANVKEVTITLFLYYYFWPHHMTCRIQNLSSLTRDRTYTPCRGSMES